MEIYTNELGHIIKMAITAIYGKNPSKMFIFRISGPFSQQGQTKENASSVSIFLCGMTMQSTFTALNTKYQGHLVTLQKYHLG